MDKLSFHGWHETLHITIQTPLVEPSLAVCFFLVANLHTLGARRVAALPDIFTLAVRLRSYLLSLGAGALDRDYDTTTLLRPRKLQTPRTLADSGLLAA